MIWDRMGIRSKKIIVGRVYDPNDIAHIEDVEFRNGLQRIFEESEEDFYDLAELFKSYGVVVHRPNCEYKGDFRYPAVCPERHAPSVWRASYRHYRRRS